MKIAPFKIERYFAPYEFTAEYTLCSSDCESMSVRDLLALEPGAQDRFQEHWLGYTETQGAPSLREEICRLYETIQPEQVLVHSGAEEAIFLFMHAALDAGDHIIVHWPCFQSLSEVALSIGCQVTPWAAREENGWALDLDELRDGICPNTKAIVVNNPHNPSGHLMSQDAFQTLNRFAQERGLLLFSDEVYRESEYRREDRLPAACDFGDHSVSLGVTSKTYGLPGLRIGWIATRNVDIYNRMTFLKDYTTICNSAPSEFLAEVGLRQREKLAARSVGIITRNLEILDDFFQRHAERFNWQRPKAGPIAFPSLKDGDIEIFCDQLVKQQSVLLLPGSVYDHPGNHFRIGFGRMNMPKALERLEAFLTN